MSNDDKWGVGNQADSKAFGVTWLGGGPMLRDTEPHLLELIHGEHPHSTQDNNTYARDPVDGEVLAFSGHRYLYSVIVDEVNYLKESHYSGDEIRKACACKLFVNGFPFYEISARDAITALRRAAAFLEGFGEGPEGYYLDAVASGKPGSLIGRRIYYRDTPAVIHRVIPDQGCIVVRPEGGDRFPLSASDIESRKEGDDDGADATRLDDFDDDDYVSVKVEVTSKSIWWWRKDVEAGAIQPDETEEELDTLAANIKASAQGVMMDVNNPVPSRLPVNTTQEEPDEKNDNG